MEKELRKQIILENYQNPANRKRYDNDKEYEKINTRNTSCVDNIDLYLKMNNDKIEDLTFDGEACVISISSTSIMTKLLKGKKRKEAIEIINNYNNMIEGKNYDKDLLKEATAYDDIAKQPSRIKCATLSWNGLYKKLMK